MLGTWIRKRGLVCKTHGPKKWQGDVVCSKCFRVYQTKDEAAPHFAPPWCACGVRLMGPTVEEDNDPRKRARCKEYRRVFSARACCHDCFERESVKQENAV